jgi:hypothetical protein
MTSNGDFADLARTLKTVMSPNQGYALFMRLSDGNFHYASTADRQDVPAPSPRCRGVLSQGRVERRVRQATV